MKRKHDRVCIVGAAPTWGDAFPKLPDCEYWGFNHLQLVYGSQRFDRWFELHHRSELEKQTAVWRNHLTWMRGQRTLPIYMQKRHPDILTSRVFPRDKIVNAFPRGTYHMSSVDWMVAFAILSAFTHIAIYGVDFGPLDRGEPIAARAGLEYWLGLAEGRGIKTWVPAESGLFSWIAYERRDGAEYAYTRNLKVVRSYADAQRKTEDANFRPSPNVEP